MLNKRIKEVIAIGMIGEGVIGFLRPQRYMRLWKFGPERYQAFIEELVEHKDLTRFICGVEAGLGVWLAVRQTSK